MDTDLEGCFKPPDKAENETETALKTAHSTQNYTTSGSEIRMSNQNLLAEQAQYIN